MKLNKENKKLVIQASALLSCLAACGMVYANTPLADYPVLGSVKTPGNLALALSVEYPTALTTAHQDATYTSATEYLGYFDPQKCYSYVPAVGDTILASAPSGYFKPATQNNKGTYTCSNGTYWSGNFLNWATTSTIDPFRWAMTGGRRVVDTPQLTILEKSYHSNQGSFPQKSVTSSATIAAATPSDAFDLQIANNGLGYKTKFTFTRKNITTTPAEQANHSYAGKFTARYWNYTTESNKWSGNSRVTIENENINKYWSDGTSPHKNVNANFSSEFIGTFIAQYDGTYTFGLLHDDYAQLIINTLGTSNFGNNAAGRQSLYSNDKYTSNNISDIKSSDTVYLRAGQSFSLRIRHYDSGGVGLISLFIKEPGSSIFKRFETVSFDYEKTPEQTVIKDEVITQEIPIRVQVCDTSVGLEDNCKKYSQSYKPEGLIQQYADEMRYSAFGYLNDHAATRDGGVMRAKMKSVGIRDFNAASNDAREWDMDTGVLVTDPDGQVPSSNNTYAIKKSGVINYLNDFGQLTTFSDRYKAIDPVGEMYYGILRYFRGEHDVPEWSNVSSLSSDAKKQAYDGFPVFSTGYDASNTNKTYPSWKNEAILLSCQKNFILGIGDTNTHKDKNLPSKSATTNNTEEPTKPTLVANDTFVDAIALTTKVGNLENLSSIKNWKGSSWGGNHNSPYMAGLAYHANFFDQRTDLGGDQTIQTFWVDVMENNDLKQPANNQFYLTTKYGGVDKSQLSETLVQKIKSGDSALTTSEKNQLADAAWKSPRTDWSERRNNQDYKPKSFFTAGNPNDMIQGLSAAFENFSAIINAYSTTLSLSTQNLSSEYTDESLTYSASYHSNGWQGDITARALVYDEENKTFNLSKDPLWQSSQQLITQFAGTGWDTKRNVVTSTRYADGAAGSAVAFRYGNLTSHQTSLLSTNYSTTDSAQAYVNWLRGDTSQEGSNYRKRTVEGKRVPLGDIINSKIQVVGAPQQNYSELDNPGYKQFKDDYAQRDTMIYVGANDGMLHAIRGGDDATKGGTELFAYIPSELFEKRAQDYGSAGVLAHLGNPNYVHKNYVDATPKITDIDFNSAGKPRPANTDATTTYQSDWRSVLIGGLGSGGRSYYAIDVTRPQDMTTEARVAGKVLWEFPAKSKLPVASGGTCTTGCIDMGYSYADPVVVKTVKYGWVVIFTSGYNNASGKGHVFIVNPKDGSLLQEITTGTTTATGMTHATAYVPDYSSMTAESLYVGDLDGQLWRFDLTGTPTSYPAPALLASVGQVPASTETGGSTQASASTQPITSKPLVEIHPITRQRMVMFGTGKLLHGNDVQFSHRQAFYAIKDGTAGKFAPAPETPITAAELRNASAGATTSTSTTATNGWYLDFGEDMWRLVSDPISNRGLVAFSAVQPLGEHCKPSGQSRVYILDFANGKSRIADGSAFIHRDAAVTELSFLRVGGKLRLAGGDAEGQVTTFGHIDQNFPARHLGWREVPVAQ